MAVAVAIDTHDRTSRIARTVEDPPLVNVAVAGGVTLLAHEAPAFVVVPRVDARVVVGLALFAYEHAPLEDAHFVGSRVAVKARLAPALRAVGLVIDEDVNHAVHVDVHRAAHIATALLDADNLRPPVAIGVQAHGLFLSQIALLVLQFGVALASVSRAGRVFRVAQTVTWAPGGQQAQG